MSSGVPSISLCIPAYNAERFVRTAIESCLQQRMAPFEVILSDNASSDGTPAILQDYAGQPNVRVHLQQEHLGIGGHYRRLVSIAGGSHVVCLSADDALHPGFMGLVRRELGQHPDLGMLAFGGFICDRWMRPVSRFGLGYPRGVMPAPQGFFHFAKSCTYVMSGAVWQREELASLPALPAEAGLSTDWFWALMAGLHGSLKLCHTPAVYYRMHEANSSHSDPRRWRRHAERMLSFMVEAGASPEAQKEVAAMSLRLKAGESAAVEGREPVAGVTVRLRGLLKRFLARCYFRHPQYLR